MFSTQVRVLVLAAFFAVFVLFGVFWWGGGSRPTKAVDGTMREAGPKDVGIPSIALPEKEAPRTSPTAVATGDSVSAEKVSMPEPLSEVEQWEKEFENASASHLLEEARALGKFITDETLDEFKRRFELGQAEYLGDDSRVPFAEIDRHLITCIIQQPGGGGNFRVILPEAEFPELYDLHRKRRWLTRTGHERRQNLLANQQ